MVMTAAVRRAVQTLTRRWRAPTCALPQAVVAGVMSLPRPPLPRSVVRRRATGSLKANTRSGVVGVSGTMIDRTPPLGAVLRLSHTSDTGVAAERICCLAVASDQYC